MSRSFKHLLRPRYLALSGACSLFVGSQFVSLDWEDIKYYASKLFNQKSKERRKLKVVVLGTGWAAMSFIQNLDMDRVDLKVISPRPFFFYTPLLAGTATGTISHSGIVEPMRWYLRTSTYVQAQCLSLDAANKSLTCGTTSGIEFKENYDFLVVAVGAETATFNIPGVSKYSFFMKEVDDSIKLQKKLLSNLEKAAALMVIGGDGAESEINKLLHWVIIGAGPTGVELTAELSDFIRQDLSKYFPNLADRVKLTLIEATGRILGPFDDQTAAYAHGTLENRDVTILCNAPVTSITPNEVEVKLLKPPSKSGHVGITSSGAQVTSGVPTPSYPHIMNVPYGAVVWAGGISARPVTKAICNAIGPAAQSSRWGLLVDSKFRVKGIRDDSVFAIGDCAVTGCGPTAQAAFQQGTYLGRLLRNNDFDLEKINQAPDFRYNYRGSLAYVGGSKAVAELKYLLWDQHPLTDVLPGSKSPTPTSAGSKGSDDRVHVLGLSGFAVWRFLYYSNLLSGRARAQVAFDWLRTVLFGREIASTTFEYLPDNRPLSQSTTVTGNNTAVAVSSPHKRSLWTWW